MVVQPLYLMWSYGGTTIIPSVKLWWYNHYTLCEVMMVWPLYLVWRFDGTTIISSVKLWYNHYT
jgi:hypothetical protein